MTRNIKYRRFLTFMFFICSVISITACTSVATNPASSPSPTNLTRSSINSTDTPVPSNTAVPTPTSTSTPESSPTPTLSPTPVLYPAPYGSEIPMDFEVITSGNIDKLQQVYMLGSGLLEKVAWSPDQNHFFISGYYGVYLYSSETWDLLLQIPSAYAFDDWRDLSPVADFSTNGRYFGVAGSNGLLIYDVTTLEQVIMLPAQDNYRDVAFFHSADRFATCTLDGKVAVYDLKGNRLADYQVETGTQPDCQKLAISTDDSRLVWVSGKKIHNWNFITGEVGKNPEFGDIFELVISADGSKLAATSWDSNGTFFTSVWNSTSGIPITRMGGQLISDYSPLTDQLATYKFATALFTQMCNGPVLIWNFSDLKLMREIAGSMGYSEVVFSPNGKYITAGIEYCLGYKEYSRFRAIRAWDIATGNVIAEYPGIFKEGWPAYENINYPVGPKRYDMNDSLQILGLTTHPASTWACTMNELTFWSMSNEVPLLPLTPDNLTQLAPPEAFRLISSEIDWTKWPDREDILSPNGNFRAGYGDEKEDYKYRLIDNRDNTVIAEFNRGTGAFTPDSKLFIFFADTNYQNLNLLEVWNLETNEQLRTVRVYMGALQEVSFTANGRLMLTKSFDQTVRWWAVLHED